MDTRIGVGILVGLVFTTTTAIISSDYYTKPQKIILGILFIFPPAQWILALIIGLWNKQTESTVGFKIDSANNSKKELERLRDIGLLSDLEFEEKTQKLIRQKLDELFLKSEEYKSLERLKKQGILTPKEFEIKIELLKEKIDKEIELGNNIELEQDESDIIKKDYYYEIVISLILGFFIIAMCFNYMNQ